MACLECRGKRWCSSCGNPELFTGGHGPRQYSPKVLREMREREKRQRTVKWHSDVEPYRRPNETDY